jgi:hypothetical protein
MASVIYPLYKRGLLLGSSGLDLDNDTATDGPYVVLIDTGTYTYSDTHQFYTSLTGIVNVEQRITGPTISTAATFDGSDPTFTSVSGASVEAVVIFRKNAGANTTWALVMYYDQPGGGLPLVPNGGNVQLTWNAAGIFTL